MHNSRRMHQLKRGLCQRTGRHSTGSRPATGRRRSVTVYRANHQRATDPITTRFRGLFVHFLSPSLNPKIATPPRPISLRSSPPEQLGDPVPCGPRHISLSLFSAPAISGGSFTMTASEAELEAPQGGGAAQTAKDLFSGAVGGIAQVLVGECDFFPRQAVSWDV